MRCPVRRSRRAYGGVLSLAKLGPSGGEYYLEQVASGREDYYTGSGEAPGVWLGAGSEQLGLEGEVTPKALRLVLASVGPDGRRLAAANRRVPGFDVTLSAPKSVSLLYAFGGPDAAREVVAAHDRAVLATVAYLEREACWTRRGRNGVIVERGGGFVAAGFRHRTSRASDPQLHTHVLIANLTRSPDGRWRTLDARELYRQQRTAGALYRAQLRAELTRRLGVSWQPGSGGVFEVAGVSEHVLRVFSQRRRQIVEHLAASGHRGSKAAELAALETRRAKQPLDLDRLRVVWRDRAEQAGMGGRAWERLVRGFARHRRDAVRSMERASVSTGELGGGLTRGDSSFGRPDVLRALADRLSGDIGDIEALADRYLASPSVAAVGEGRYSTPEHLQIERHVLTLATGRRDEGTAVVDDAKVDVVIDAQPIPLSAEQEAMVRRLTTAGHGVDVVVGHPGSGKTHALAAAAQAWRRSGHDVIGTALAARAALELHHSIGGSHATIASLTAHWQHEQLRPGTVVIVDEAGMVGTRTLHQLASLAARDRAKLVLVGDPRQLPEIEAGGAFRALARQLDAVELTENRRQRDRHERRAIRDLRAGRVDKALRRLDAQGRVTRTLTVGDACQQMITDWQRTPDRDRVLLLAARRSDVAHLNDLAQAARHAAGELRGEPHTIGQQQWFEGDRVQMLRNDRQLGVLNGQRGILTRIGDATLTITLDDGGSVELRRTYVQDGHLQLGYASTIHKAQGATVDRSLLLATSEVGLEAAYTALTRGRDENHLYLADRDDPLHHHLELRRAKHLAISHGLER